MNFVQRDFSRGFRSTHIFLLRGDFALLQLGQSVLLLLLQRRKLVANVFAGAHRLNVSARRFPFRSFVVMTRRGKTSLIGRAVDTSMHLEVE